MDNLTFDGDFKGPSGKAIIRLQLIQFKDDDGITIIYAPMIDLSGYGHSIKAAQESFEIVLADFLDYTMKKNSLGKILKELGWEFHGSTKKPKKITPPSMSDFIRDNKYVSEIFDKYPVNTYHKKVDIPAYA